MAANTTPVVSPSKSADTSPRAAWLALAGCLLGLFMQMLDTTIVNIALPDLTVELEQSMFRHDE